jgi:hypothetical protein
MMVSVLMALLGMVGPSGMLSWHTWNGKYV